ncbi:RuvB-like protein 2 [Tanacetum coccineum]
MKSFRNSIGVKLKEEAEFIEGEVVKIQIDHRRWNAIYFDYGYLNGELAVTRSLGDRLGILANVEPYHTVPGLHDVMEPCID